ncbi:MAG TPA: hypothetical protein VFR41_07055, partial [Acidimicrobiia bacterium]|nr:hypothetical protein [Acidimicrobiia bacterium]
TIDGGPGVDTIRYGYSTVGVMVMSMMMMDRGALGDTDVLTDYEIVRGSDHDDTMMVDPGVYAYGMGGDDMVQGGPPIVSGRAQYLYGGSGSDECRVWYANGTMTGAKCHDD